MNLLMLSHLVDEAPWADRIERTLRLFGTRLEQMGRAVPMMAAALSTYIAGLQQIVIVGSDRKEEADALVRGLAEQYLPFAVTLRVDRAGQAALAGILPAPKR
jgi:uncharacterized protein YyaL (SSP411 family)